MTKLEVQKRVLKDGKPLDLELFEWRENTRIFSSSENGLVLDFKDIDKCIFNTCSYCTFKTGSDCIFNTDSYCTFDTGSSCTFDTGLYCTFDTCYDCIFVTGAGCTFITAWNCNFATGENSVVVRKDIFEVIVLEDERNEIQLNECETKGYRVLESKTKIVINGKEIEVSNEDLEYINKIVNKGK